MSVMYISSAVFISSLCEYNLMIQMLLLGYTY